MDSTAYTPQQLAQALRGQRKTRKLTQKQTAVLVGLLPKTISNLETNPQSSTIESLFKLLSALELELVIRPKASTDKSSDHSSLEW